MTHARLEWTGRLRQRSSEATDVIWRIVAEVDEPGQSSKASLTEESGYRCMDRQRCVRCDGTDAVHDGMPPVG